MKAMLRVSAAALAAALVISCAPPADSKDKGEDIVSSLSAPADILLDGTAATVSVGVGYNNDFASPLGLKLVTSDGSDVGYTPLDEALAGEWADTGLDLGTKSLQFEFAGKKGGADADPHVGLSFKSLTGLSHSGATGFTFNIKFVSPVSGGAVGLMPHLRYNDGTSENAATFAYEMWWYKTDDNANFTIKIPFTAFTKPGYGGQSETSIADWDEGAGDGLEFNQIDFDIRVAPTVSGSFLQDTKYKAVIDNVGYYTDAP